MERDRRRRLRAEKRRRLIARYPRWWRMLTGKDPMSDLATDRAVILLGHEVGWLFKPNGWLYTGSDDDLVSFTGLTWPG